MDSWSLSARVESRGSTRHNNREFTADNIDASRSSLNLCFVRDDLRQVYSELFSDALNDYNLKKKKSRDKIPDYYEHIRTGKQEKLFHEVIFQLGNKDSAAAASPDGELAKTILTDFYSGFVARNPHMRVFNAVLHVDEATPHLHIDVIPYATEQSRGLSTRVSLSRALEQQGFVGVSKNESSLHAWVDSEKEQLAAISREYGRDVEFLGGGLKHESVKQFKAQQRTAEALQQSQDAEAELASIVEIRNDLKLIAPDVTTQLFSDRLSISRKDLDVLVANAKSNVAQNRRAAELTKRERAADQREAALTAREARITVTESDAAELVALRHEVPELRKNVETMKKQLTAFESFKKAFTALAGSLVALFGDNPITRALRRYSVQWLEKADETESATKVAEQAFISPGIKQAIRDEQLAEFADRFEASGYDTELLKNRSVPAEIRRAIASDYIRGKSISERADILKIIKAELDFENQNARIKNNGRNSPDYDR